MEAIIYILGFVAIGAVIAVILVLSPLGKYIGVPPEVREPIAPYLKFTKGTTITCPKCGQEIATANRDIYSFERISSIPWDGVEMHDDMRCPKDRTPYIKFEGGVRVHTTHGWISRSPEAVNVS